MSIDPYQIQVEQSVLDDLQKRLKRTRWTDQEAGAGWSQGTSLAYLKEFISYWKDDYDWRKEEAKLNAYAWHQTIIDGKKVRFIHEKGKGQNPTPLILLHGWPDSVVRYLRLIPLLTDPASHGGSAHESFDVIIPSFVGGFTDTPGAPSQQEIRDLAEISWQLMSRRLGYQQFMAGGGDGGSPIAQLMAVDHPESILGLHLSDIGWHTSRRDRAGLTENEQQYLQGLDYKGFAEGAYAMLQGTKPQTLALGLHDSPAGMAAWILEKFRSWSDCDGELEKVFTKDELITNIMFYWLKNSVKSFSYKEEFVSPSISPDQKVEVPVALAFPPNDMAGTIPPREFAARNLKDIRRWNVLGKGGHFVAMEYPELLANDLRASLPALKP